MIYTILDVDVCHFPYRLILDHEGNKYSVTIYDKEEHKTLSYRLFDTMDKAYEIFGTLVEWYAKSLYKQEDKEKYLQTGIKPY